MLKNYLKITWAVMKRRKFYTFISLFGICFKLTIVLSLISIYILVVLCAFFPSRQAAQIYPAIALHES